MTLHLYFVRHGQTLFNLINKFQGWCDSDLTDKGIQDAINAGNRLQNVSFINAYSSDLKRANDTAKYIISQNKNNPNLEINILKSLREQYFGGFEASVISDTMKLLGVKEPTSNSFRQLCKEKGFSNVIDEIANKDTLQFAENSAQYSQRIKSALEQIVTENKNLDGNILITTHSNTIKMINHSLGHVDNCYVSVSNGSVTRVIYQNGKFTLDIFNDNTTTF